MSRSRLKEVEDRIDPHILDVVRDISDVIPLNLVVLIEIDDSDGVRFHCEKSIILHVYSDGHISMMRFGKQVCHASIFDPDPVNRIRRFVQKYLVYHLEGK